MFRHAPSRGGRGRRAAVDFVVCFGWGGFVFVCFFRFLFFGRTQLAASMRKPCLVYLSTITGVRTGRHLLVCRCVCRRRRFTDCESCTRPISINPGSMEAGKHGLTRRTCFVARRLEVVAVAGLLWISWCVLCRADFFRVFFSILFSSNAHGLLQV